MKLSMELKELRGKVERLEAERLLLEEEREVRFPIGSMVCSVIVYSNWMRRRRLLRRLQ